MCLSFPPDHTHRISSIRCGGQEQEKEKRFKGYNILHFSHFRFSRQHGNTLCLQHDLMLH